ncbi:presequence translocated-associated motor subunit Pam17p, mitochondrial [Trichomonascus vanleenenianus]|uniref:Pam17p n=1 Tax=Trichomonascus vanleenenianus TaxID=2268995 RepID=UPI003ECA6856
MRPSVMGPARFVRLFQSARPLLNKTASDLTWNEFLTLRIKQRRVNVASSCVTALGGMLVGWGFIANIEIDPTEPILGFDPFMVSAAGLIVCGFLGYMAGPSVGTVVFKNFIIRKQAASFAKKNTDFLRHVRKNRPDPSKQSYGNPVTDYYGEKIGSLKDYRRWLRDGRAYRRKAEKFL